MIIQNKILNSTQQQSIIYLHDAGHDIYSDPDAPKRMIEALKTTLPILKNKDLILLNLKGVLYE